MNLISYFTKIKIYMMRSSSVMGVITSGMILFVFIDVLKRYGVDISLGKWFIPILTIFYLTMTLMGYLEVRMGFLREEQEQVNLHNPILLEINERLKRLELR